MGKSAVEIWDALRVVIQQNFTFSEIKGLVGSAGLPLNKLSHLQQRALPARSSSKSELMDAVTDLIHQDARPDHTVVELIRNVCVRKAFLKPELNEVATRFGWRLLDGELRTSEFDPEQATLNSSEEVREALVTAQQRYAIGDFDGAMTGVCGAIDTLTSALVTEHRLGKPQEFTFQERVVKCLALTESAFKQRLSSAGVPMDEAIQIWHNYRGAVNQAAFVLGAFRRHLSDVHGVKECSPPALKYAVDCGTFIIRSLSSMTVTS